MFDWHSAHHHLCGKHIEPKSNSKLNTIHHIQPIDRFVVLYALLYSVTCRCGYSHFTFLLASDKHSANANKIRNSKITTTLLNTFKQQVVWRHRWNLSARALCDDEFRGSIVYIFAVVGIVCSDRLCSAIFILSLVVSLYKSIAVAMLSFDQRDTYLLRNVLN